MTGQGAALAGELERLVDNIRRVPPGADLTDAVDALGTWAFNSSPSLLAALSHQEPDAGAVERVDYRGIALAALKRGRQAGESHEMIARWISEDIHAALSADPKGET